MSTTTTTKTTTATTATTATTIIILQNYWVWYGEGIYLSILSSSPTRDTAMCHHITRGLSVRESKAMSFKLQAVGLHYSNSRTKI